MCNTTPQLFTSEDCVEIVRIPVGNLYSQELGIRNIPSLKKKGGLTQEVQRRKIGLVNFYCIGGGYGGETDV